MKWSNEIILEFLRLYEKEPAIWDPRNVSHKDRFAVTDAWKRIEANMSVPCPVVELKRKKDSLMATFRSLTVKVKASIDLGKGPMDVYKPNWFAYETMAKFLGAIYHPKAFSPKEEMDDTDSRSYDNEQAYFDPGSPVPEDVQETDDDPIYSFMDTSVTFKQPLETKVRKRPDPVPVEPSSCPCEHEDNDECSLFTQLLAKKLRSLDEHTREEVMHEIDNLVFRFKMRKRRKFDDSSLDSGMGNKIPLIEDNSYDSLAEAGDNFSTASSIHSFRNSPEHVAIMQTSSGIVMKTETDD